MQVLLVRRFSRFDCQSPDNGGIQVTCANPQPVVSGLKSLRNLIQDNTVLYVQEQGGCPLPETPGELFTMVPVDLFRMGNASGPRLDNVRSQDVDFAEEKLPNGQVIRMVHPRGGISTFDGINRKRPGKWWRIPANTVLPDTIRVVRDQRDPFTQLTHYSLRPARYMTLLEFVSGLQILALKAVPMFTLQGGSGESETGGR
jgi:hypothetical protein